jgi:hypothetical protein
MPLQIMQPPVLTEGGVTTPPPIAVPDQFATVRTNPITGRLDHLGVVGTKYEPVQNEESCALLDALTEDSGAVYETLGRCEAVGNLCHDEAAQVDDLRRPARLASRSPMPARCGYGPRCGCRPRRRRRARRRMPASFQTTEGHPRARFYLGSRQPN